MFLNEYTANFGMDMAPVIRAHLSFRRPRIEIILGRKSITSVYAVAHCGLILIPIRCRKQCSNTFIVLRHTTQRYIMFWGVIGFATSTSSTVILDYVLL